MTKDQCKLETIKHIENVRRYIRMFTDKLTQRGVDHDKPKLEPPELDIFTQYTPMLVELQYGSEEYHECIKNMNVALEHHYANCRHHPEHFANGINDMDLIDLVEMFCDWKAATLRQNNGNLLKSIDINAERFGYDEQLKQIFINTARIFDDI